MSITEAYLREVMSLSREQLGMRMRRAEIDQGFAIIKNAIWLDWNEWDDGSIFALDGRRVRLVAIQAKHPGTGAFTRLIAKIQAAGLVPVLVEPNRSLTDWCHRHDYRSRKIGKGHFHHEIWYPRK